jgi:hypothetical protein
VVTSATVTVEASPVIPVSLALDLL